MKTVFEASSAVEAHMVRDLLRQAGVVAHIHGEHLQGAIGELPAGSLVRLVVEEDDFAQARAVVEQWDAAQPADAPRTSPPVRSRLLSGLVIGALVGATASWALLRSPGQELTHDRNGDGRADEHWTMRASGYPLRLDVDRNFDGRIDSVTHFDERGNQSWAEGDDDFDGRNDNRLSYRDGNLERADMDTDGDGAFDRAEYHTSGVLTHARLIDPSSGRVLAVQHFRLGRMTHTELDTDQDGRLDTVHEFGRVGELRDSRRLPETESPAS